MTAPLFYVDAVPDTVATIGGPEARHALAAMRVTPGEIVLVGDGRGTVAECVVVSADRRHGLVAEIVERRTIPAPRTLVVLQAVPKGERAEAAVELMTEAGVSRIDPWLSQRTIPDWRDKQEAKRERWRRVARAAAKQSRRAWAPEIGDVRTGVPACEGSVLVLHEEADLSLYDMDAGRGPLTVVVGPEGGLTEAEVAAFVGAGASAVRMGPQILRTSTAGAAACLWIRGLEMRLGT